MFEPEKAAFYDKMMNERIEDDYNDYMILDEDEVIKFIEPVTKYVEYVSKLIDEYFDAQSNNSTSEPIIIS